MDDHQIHRDIGRLEGKVEAQGHRLDQLFEKLDSYHDHTSSKMETLIAYQQRQRGAAKVWALVTTAAATGLSLLVAWWKS